MKPGTRYRSAVCRTEVVIVRGSDDVALECGGAAMVPATAPAAEQEQPEAGWDGGTLLGKRYEDPATGLELLCVRPGAGSLSVSGRAMTVKAAKQLPASD